MVIFKGRITSSLTQPSVPEPKMEMATQENGPAIMLGQLVKEFLADSQIKGCTNDHDMSIAYAAEKLFYPHFGKDTLMREIT